MVSSSYGDVLVWLAIIRALNCVLFFVFLLGGGGGGGLL